MNFSRLKGLLPLLIPLSWLYEGIIRLRNRLYDWGIFTVHWVPAPVVSVGNVTVGGTGKTPIVILLGQMYRARGKRVGILTRGYGRVSKESVLVFEGESEVTPEKIGDEPYLIFQNLKGVPIVVDKNRWRGGLALWRKEPVDVFLLDDGFQYRALSKQVEIAVLDAARPFGNGRVFPAGWLREPVSAL
ncbi:MAG: tetraacyldisaccharide 4'-kinase, partial [Calditrichaeota bacterium]|nr:tetraacyldisaccharide 4'-kinase [Calditrichota bacterium]